MNRFDELEGAVEEMRAARRPVVEEYQGRARMEDRNQRRAARKGEDRWLTMPFDFFDAYGASAAAVVTANAYADAAVAAAANQQTFSGATLSASITGGQYILGDATNGLPSKNAKPLTVLVVQAQVALALLTSVTVKVVNFTQSTNASVTILAGETYHRATINLAKAVNDEIGLLVDSDTGAPSAGIFNVWAL